jgi:hypothetical protein
MSSWQSIRSLSLVLYALALSIFPVMHGTRVRPSAGPSTSLVPGIHALLCIDQQVLDGRDEPGHDGVD